MGTRQETAITYDHQGNVVNTRIVTVTTTPEQDNEDTLWARADAALVDLGQITSSTGTLTAAQLSNAVRVIARATAALIRLQLRRLDATDGT